MSERTAEATTTVDEDGIRVEKSFTDDAFPVPAVTYDLSSARDDPVRVRVVDRIPEDFPMERIGFHPDYESENWTAYKDHRVEFERVIDPGDTIETVFGIRDDDPDLDGFLGTPVIEHVPVGEEIEDVLGAGDADAVREVLAGDRTTLPGMEEPLDPEGDDGETADVDATAEAEATVNADSETAEVDEAADAGDEAIDTGGGIGDDEDASVAPAPRAVTESGTAAVTSRSDDDAIEPGLGEEDEAGGESETADEPDTEIHEEPAQRPDETPVSAPESGLAAALAAEIRSGEVDESDLATLRSELDVGVPKSVDVRIARLQSSVADIEAYADALAEFIDGEGTAREILDDLDEKVDAVESEMAAIDDRLDDAETAREDLREDVSRVDGSVESIAADVDGVADRMDGVSERVDDVETDLSSVDETVSEVETSVENIGDDVSRIDEETTGITESIDDLGDDVETLYEEVDDAAAGLEATDERVGDVEARLGRFDEEFDDLWDDLAEVDTRLTDIEDRLGEDLDDVEAELDGIHDHLEELEAFRKRLNEAFGP